MSWQAKLSNLNFDRREKLRAVIQKKNSWEASDMYKLSPPEWKEKTRRELKAEYDEVNREFTEQAKKVLEEAREAAMHAYYNEPVESASKEMYKLRRFLEAEALKRNLVELWRQKPDVTFREKLFEEAEKRLVYEHDAATARAYVEALGELFGRDPGLKGRVNELREALDEVLNTREHQVVAQKMLEEIDEAERAVHLEILEDRLKHGFGSVQDSVTVERARKKKREEEGGAHGTA